MYRTGWCEEFTRTKKGLYVSLQGPLTKSVINFEILLGGTLA